ncbi:transposable element Tc3 transposase [Trichonephila clavipes]|nr:transposable element Tc3 transposase [Trichonephila clavipes]
MPIEAFNQFRSHVATEIRKLDFSVEIEVMYKDLKSSIENIPKDFVITYVDKVSANYAIICKYFYTHFWLYGYVNKQNCRIWSETNPQVYVETPLHPKNWLFGVLYGLVESFFKNDEGHNVTVNGDRYKAIITNFFIPELNNHDVQELCFQQDGATCHTARATIDLLKDTFGDRLISRFGPVNWPPRSCDLTPLDYFLRGYVKSLVYVDKPQTLDHLEDNIAVLLPIYGYKCWKSHRKLDVQIGLHPSQPWQSYARNHI